MTVENLIAWLSRHPLALAGALPGVPDVFSAVLSVYALFFRNADLLGVIVLVHFLPIASMAATLILTSCAVRSLDEVPGFDRLSGDRDRLSGDRDRRSGTEGGLGP